MRDRVMIFDMKRIVVVKLLYCVVMLEQGVEHLRLLSCYSKEWVVSVSNDKSSNDVWYNWKSSYKVTMLRFNAWARCRAPSAPIEFWERQSCLSA